jgi:hypothetical protein
VEASSGSIAVRKDGGNRHHLNPDSKRGRRQKMGAKGALFVSLNGFSEFRLTLLE